METSEKTRLQKIKEQLSEKMTRAIVQAIEDGAKYERAICGGLYIDEVYLTAKCGTRCHGIFLDIDAPEIEQLFEPTNEELEKRAEKLRAELNEIYEQIKSKKQ